MSNAHAVRTVLLINATQEHFIPTRLTKLISHCCLKVSASTGSLDRGLNAGIVFIATMFIYSNHNNLTSA
ncbi:MAG: hypothetical protein ACRCYF_10520, partial [Shewanella sp.]